MLGTARMPQLAQRLGLDLADALAGHVEFLADLFKSMRHAVAQAETHLEDLLFARRELAHGLVHVHFKELARGRTVRREGSKSRKFETSYAAATDARWQPSHRR